MDIVPELLEEIQKLFKKNFDSNKRIDSLLKLSEEGKATYKDAQDFAYEVGNILADVFKDKISSDILPDGRMFYNIAKRILEPTLENNHHIAADYAVKVQDDINKKAKIGIKAVEPEVNKDKIDGLIEIVSEKEYDKVAYTLDEPVVNFTQTVVDDTVKANAKFHYEAGLSPKVKRISTGKCCEWCNRLAGTYNYKDVSDTGNNVFRRHKNCRCVVEFLPGKGKVQNVHTKTRYQDKDDFKDEIITKESSKLKSLAFSEAKKRGYDPIPTEKVVNILREESVKWRDVLLRDEEKLAIEKYTFNGVDSDGKKLYEKINGFLGGCYIPANEKEEKMILKFIVNIKGAILKYNLEDDIIVFRKEYNVKSLEKLVKKFLSTSVTTKGAFGGNPNVAILVPKGTRGAYIEPLSQIHTQREFLLDSSTILHEVLDKDGLHIFEVIKDG